MIETQHSLAKQLARHKTKQHVRRRRQPHDRRGPDKYQRFHDQLSISGYASYDDYLHSEAWRLFNEWYRSSELPQQCLVCGAKKFLLHHWTYERAGSELPCDVLPLCERHHHELHAWLLKSGVPLQEVHRHLVECFGFKHSRARDAFRPFLNMHKDARRTPRSPYRRRDHDETKRPKSRTPKAVCPKCQKERGLSAFVDGLCTVCIRRAKKIEERQAKQCTEEVKGMTGLRESLWLARMKKKEP